MNYIRFKPEGETEPTGWWCGGCEVDVFGLPPDQRWVDGKADSNAYRCSGCVGMKAVGDGYKPMQQHYWRRHAEMNGWELRP